MILNGIAIVGVVLSHAAGWGQIAMFSWADQYMAVMGVPNDQVGSLAYYVLYFIRQITSLSVPAFLLTSGFFVAFAIRGNNYSPASWKFVKSRLINLLIPYTIWSVLIFIADYFINDIRLTPLVYLELFLTIGATGPYYFVPLLSSFYLLSPFLAPLAKTKPRLLLGAALAIQLIPVMADYVRFLFGVHAPVFDQIVETQSAFAPHWIFFFATGLVFGYNIERVRTFIEEHRRQLLIGTVVFGVLALIEPEVIFRTSGMDLRWLPLTFSGLLYAYAATFLMLSYPIENGIFTKQAYWLGSRSYGIYLVHWKAMEFIARLIYHFAIFLLGIQLLFQPILLVFGLGVPVLVIYYLLKSPLRKTYPYLFG